MNTEERVRIYGNAYALTAPQRRRAAKKDRRAKQRLVAYVQISEDRWAFLDRRYPA